MERSGFSQISGATQRDKWAVLKDFQASFFAMNRLASLPWKFLENDLESNKSSKLILDILKRTCLHSLCQKFPPSAKYRRLFLTELIRRLEAAACEPVDELYEALSDVVAAADTMECYKSYLLPCGDAVSLMENVAVISEGTTGLVTWEAALYLAEWALDHQQFFTGRAVLELGSGMGLTGITVCRSCRPSRYVFSDCHPKVLQTLRDNVRQNGLAQGGGPAGHDDLALAQWESPSVSVKELDWMEVTEEWLEEIRAETVIAADVVYDPDVVEILVQLLCRILRRPSADAQPHILICSTVRNPETYSGFKQQLGNAGISHHVITGPVSHIFPYNRTSTIEIIKLYT